MSLVDNQLLTPTQIISLLWAHKAPPLSIKHQEMGICVGIVIKCAKAALKFFDRSLPEALGEIFEKSRYQDYFHYRTQTPKFTKWSLRAERWQVKYDEQGIEAVAKGVFQVQRRFENIDRSQLHTTLSQLHMEGIQERIFILFIGNAHTGTPPHALELKIDKKPHIVDPPFGCVDCPTFETLQSRLISHLEVNYKDDPLSTILECTPKR